MNTLARRIKTAEDLFPSPMEAVLLKHLVSHPNAEMYRWTPERLRAEWRRTRERIGYTWHEEAAFAEMIDRAVTAIMAVGKEAAMAELPLVGDPTPEAAKEANQTLHAQPLGTVSDYLKDRSMNELWEAAFNRASLNLLLQKQLKEADRGCQFWEVGSVGSSPP